MDNEIRNIFPPNDDEFVLDIQEADTYDLIIEEDNPTSAPAFDIREFLGSLDDDWNICPTCGEKKLKDIDGQIFDSPCKCDRTRKEQWEEEEREKYHAILSRQLKAEGLTDPEYLNWTFAADDRKYPYSKNY